MDKDDSKRAFWALLADLALIEPRDGYSGPEDVKLVTSQIADVIDFEIETVADAMVDALPLIAARLREGAPSPADMGAIVMSALDSAARRVVARELVPYVERYRACADLDAAYEAGRPFFGPLSCYAHSVGVPPQGGL